MSKTSRQTILIWLIFLLLSAFFCYLTFTLVKSSLPDIITEFSLSDTAANHLQQPFIATAILLISVIGLAVLHHRYPLNKSTPWLTAALVLVIITPIALSGFWPNSHWGISDWDYYFSYHTAVRHTIIDYHSFPQWNPYICGGTSAIGDPEFPLFTPTFLLELIFGVPIGLRLASWFATAIGAIGFLFLAKKFKVSLSAALLASLIFAFSSINLLEIVEGHPNIFSAMWVPWIFWSWLNAYGVKLKDKSQKLIIPTNAKPTVATANTEQSPTAELQTPGLLRSWFLKLYNLFGPCDFDFSTVKWVLLCGIFLAATFMQGGIYMLMYVGIAFLFLIITLPRRFASLLVTLTAGIWALAFSAIKLMPVFLWLAQFQDKAYASSTYLLPWLHKIFLGRFLHGSENVIPFQNSGWHEYGSYLGPFALALAATGIITTLRNRSTKLLILATTTAIIIASSGPLLKPMFDAAPFLPRSNISRFLLFAIIPIALLAARGLDALTSHLKPFLAQSIKIIILGILCVDLLTFATALSEQAFVLTPFITAPAPPGPILYSNNAHVIRYKTVDYTRAFAEAKAGYKTASLKYKTVDYTRAFAEAKAGYGTMSYCSVLGPQPAVKVMQDQSYEGFATLSPPSGSVSVLNWTPQQIVITTTTDQPAELDLNVNYARGWTVNSQPAKEVDNKLAAQVLAGTSTLIFTYHAPGLITGTIITLISLTAAALISIYLFLHHKKT